MRLHRKCSCRVHPPFRYFLPQKDASRPAYTLRKKSHRCCSMQSARPVPAPPQLLHLLYSGKFLYNLQK